MQVLERSIIGKHPDQARCEDVVAVTDTHAAIFDGAGEIGTGPPGMTGARFAATFLGEALAEVDPAAPFVDAAAFLTSALEDQIRARIGYLEPPDRPCAVAVIYSAPRREIWRVGDPHFAINGAMHLGALAVSRPHADFRSGYLRLLMLSGASRESLIRSDPTVDLIRPVLEKLPRLRNSDADTGWEFGAFDGTAIPPKFLEVVEVPPQATEVVLTSDGYPEPSASLAKAEARIQVLLRDDPLCIADFRSEKGLREGMLSFDDRSYIRLQV